MDGGSWVLGSILIFGLDVILLDDISVILHSSISLLLQIIPLHPALLPPHCTQSGARFRLVQSLAERAIGLLGNIHWPWGVAFSKLNGLFFVGGFLLELLAIAGSEGDVGSGG